METKISELQDLCEEVFNLKAEVDRLNEEKTNKNKRITEIKSEIVKHFEAHELERFDSGFGTVIKKVRRSVSIEDRNAFFNFLEDRKLLRDSLNITAAKATTIYNELFERAEEEQDTDFIMSGIPGLSEPKTFTDVSINKPRKRKL